MRTPFIGREAMASGQLTRHKLRSRFVAIYPGVYIDADARLTARDRAKAAWLWSRRRGVLAGRSAAAMHGAKYVDPWLPAEILHDNRHAPKGLRVFSDVLDEPDVMTVDGIPVTTPVRTAVDIARRYPFGPAVTAIDTLANATRLTTPELRLLARRYPGLGGIRRAEKTLQFVDPGSESPKETWLRLLVIRNGFPPPETQIPVYNEHGVLVAVLDMGWRDRKLALDYEGEHHRNAVRFNTDIRRHDEVTDLGWTDIRVTSLDTEAVIIARLTAEWARSAKPAAWSA
ncbi:hypothetical protein [Mycolicibacterium pulveris]|uniref:hypothetical protein n=1 Tax=Mycolicibacterium pulveris TaxID=36813 RepID=UPI003CEC988A